MGGESGKQPLGVCLFFAAFAAFCGMSGLVLMWVVLCWMQSPGVNGEIFGKRDF
jgi:hypothetical protein